MQTDLMTVEVNTRKLFKIWIPDREEWNRGKILAEFTNIVYTPMDPRWKVELAQGSSPSSVLQNPISSQIAQAFLKRKLLRIGPCEYLLNLITPHNRVAIATDSQATKKALNSFTVKSRVVKSCLESIIGKGLLLFSWDPNPSVVSERIQLGVL